MSANSRYLIYHDLIGFNAYARLKSIENGFSDIGMVIDETRNMLITEKEKKIKKYIKKDHVFRFKIQDNKEADNGILVEVIGTKIVGLPENRLRALRRKRWYKR